MQSIDEYMHMHLGDAIRFALMPYDISMYTSPGSPGSEGFVEGGVYPYTCTLNKNMYVYVYF